MPTQKKKKRIWIWIVLALVVLLIAGLLVIQNAIKNATTTVYASYTVETGTVKTTVTGSGRLTSLDSETLQLPGEITVADVIAKAGDSVKAGDVLATLDTASLAYRAAEVNSELATLDREIASRASVSSVKSPVRGRVKYLPVSEGQSVLSAIDQYGALALLSSDGLMQVEIASTAELELYSTVTVRWDGGDAKGTVLSKTAEGYLITLTDDETPYQAKADVYDGDTLLGSGTIGIHAPVAVLAAGGQIEDVSTSENSSVSAGATLLTLENEPNTASYQTSLTERTDKAALYQTLLVYLQDPRVLAPVDGVVSDLTILEGEQTAASALPSGLTDALTIHTGGAVKMSIDVDELDIDTVALGQSVAVTLDAYPGESFAAVVTHISRIGSVSGSITTYAVEVTLDFDTRLLEGMNGSAVIKTNKVENVLLVPIEAIFEDSAGEYVTVRSADGKSYSRLDITTGLSDGTNAEVTNGLAAGDVIWYPEAAAAVTFPGMNYSQNRMEDYQEGTASNSNGGE